MLVTRIDDWPLNEGAEALEAWAFVYRAGREGRKSSVQANHEAVFGACNVNAWVGPLDEGLEAIKACVGTCRAGRKGRERHW